MSIWHAGSWVAQQEGLSPPERHVLTVLFMHKNFKTGQCNPSQATLARETGYSERSIRTHLKTLVDKELIERESQRRSDGTRSSDKFTINFDQDEWELIRKDRKDKRKDLPVDAEATGKSRQDNRQISPEQPEDISGKHLIEHQEEQDARAREANGGASPHGAGDDDGDDAATARKEAQAAAITKVCTVWNENQNAIKAAVGEKPYQSWLHGLIPLKDDAETLTLGCYSTLIGQIIERDFGEIVGKILDRRIVCEFRPWISDAVRRRDEHQSRKGTANGVRAPERPENGSDG